MGKLFKFYLEGEDIYCCSACHTHLTSVGELESTTFSAGKYKATLFKSCINVILGPAENRQMTTGMHTVCDLYCIECESELGWKYLVAIEAMQKYKEGKFILVENKILKQSKTVQTLQEVEIPEEASSSEDEDDVESVEQEANEVNAPT